METETPEAPEIEELPEDPDTEAPEPEELPGASCRWRIPGDPLPGQLGEPETEEVRFSG